MANETKETVEALVGAGRVATARPHWPGLLKFALTKPEVEAVRTWRAERKTIEGKLALVSPPAIAKLRKSREQAIATHATDPGRDPLGGQVDRRSLERAAKISRTRLKEAGARIDHGIALALLGAGDRLHGEAEAVIEKVVSQHEAHCRQFGLPPMPNGLVAALRQSLGPLERALARGRVSPSAIAEYVTLPL